MAEMKRTPVGIDTVNVGGPDFATNGGPIEFADANDYSGGQMFGGGRNWGLMGYGPQQTWNGEMANFQPSPGIDELQVEPLNPEVNYSAEGGWNGMEDAFKGNRG